jgi:hypothetical protein
MCGEAPSKLKVLEPKQFGGVPEVLRSWRISCGTWSSIFELPVFQKENK